MSPVNVKEMAKVLKHCVNQVSKALSMAVFMLETLKLSKTLKSSRDDFNVKYKNGKLYLTLKSSRDDFNVLDNFNVSSIKTANAEMEIPKGDWSSWTVTCLKFNTKDHDTISFEIN